MYKINNKGSYHDTLFMIPSLQAFVVLNEFEKAREDLEKVNSFLYI